MVPIARRVVSGLFLLWMLALSPEASASEIDLKLHNVTVREAVEALNRQEKFSVAIKSADIDMQRRVSISVTNASIEEVLDQIQSSNIRVVADLSEISQTGIMYVPVRVIVDGFTDAGAVGDYMIAIKIRS